MIGTVRLAASGLVTSRIGFGTSRLHHVDPAARRRLLETAAGLGIVHFDTAPSYGDALAERALGDVLRAQRHRLIIASKYGFAPNPLIAAAPALAYPLQGARTIARKLGLAPSKRPAMTADHLLRSVEQSLRRLRTDWLDILFLHEPSPECLPSPDAVLEALVRLKEKGVIRHYGVAGAWPGIAALGKDARLLGQVVQTGERGWLEERPPDITYGAIAAGPQSVRQHAIGPPTARARLRTALARRGQGVVLVSTTSPQHLRELAEAVAAPVP